MLSLKKFSIFCFYQTFLQFIFFLNKTLNFFNIKSQHVIKLRSWMGIVCMRVLQTRDLVRGMSRYSRSRVKKWTNHLFSNLNCVRFLMAVEFTSNAALKRVFWLYKHCWSDDRNMLTLNLKTRYK